MNTRAHRCLLAFTSLTSVVSLALLFGWGPLTPPAGIVTGTAKPLSEVEPRTAVNAANTPGDATSLFIISQPGSYYLTGNVTGVSGRNGILITTPNVTLDLRGFALTGVAGSSSGIIANLNANVTVRSGSVIGWGGTGLLLGTGARVCDVAARGNSSIGIRGLDDSEVRNCSTSGGAAGISVGNRSRVESCIAASATGIGIQTSDFGVVTACTASANQQGGISVGHAATVTNCAAGGNGLTGINLGDGAAALDCTTMENVIGILALRGSAITRCSAKDNQTHGISVDNGCTVTGNTCERNGFGSGGAGVALTGAANRVEGNHCRGADFGVYCAAPAAGNVVVRNTCSANTIDWVFGGNNIYGPIIDRRVPASPPVSGFSSASATGTVDPLANISH